MASLTTPMTLSELVRRYQVCWEVWPEYPVMGQRSQQVGFELELFGSDKRVGEFDPSCPDYAEIHAALEAIARWILERDERVSFQINHNGHRLCYSRARRNRPDVTLSINILRRTGFENPVDESERNCFKKVEAHLRQMGACEHQWYFARAAIAEELEIEFCPRRQRCLGCGDECVVRECDSLTQLSGDACVLTEYFLPQLHSLHVLLPPDRPAPTRLRQCIHSTC
jgi:hypothetical protein